VTDSLAQILWLALLGVLGLVFGSFANVVIWRFPRGESLSSPPSHCPRCGHPIRWRDNIPVVSWLLLRGRCRDCGEPISARYPLVEAASGLLWVLAGVLYGISAQTGVAVFLFYLLLVLSMVDLDTMRLPNPLVALLASAGVAGVLISQVAGIPAAPLTPSSWAPLPAALIGAALGAGVSLAVASAYRAVRKATGFGMGDVKLLGALGLYFGAYVLMVLFFGSLIGAVAGIIFAASSKESLRRKRMPFGPMLALGAVVTAVFGPALWSWYLGLTGL